MMNFKWMVSVLLGVLLSGISSLLMAQGKTEVQWLGQSAVKITTPGGKVIVIDPWLINNPKTPEQYKKLEALGKVDLILVTHGHGDHFADAPALSKLNNAPVYGHSGMLQSAITLGILPREMGQRFNKGGTVIPPGTNIKITMMNAEHGSELIWRNLASGKDEAHVGGEPIGFIIELENGFKIYHMGDTGVFGDMKFIGEYYKPDLILIPIGGHYVMHPKEAAFATKELLKPRFAIPIHYGTLPEMKGTPAEYIEALGKSSTKIFAMNPGDKLEF
jgi:L-ascorbate metabolism protein UlaG (beta-lactamase superfamily)